MGYRALRYGSAATLVILGLIGAALCLAGNRVYTVPTDSMQPQLQPGDAVVVRTRSPDVTLGRVISFRDKSRPWLVVSHRVISLNGNQLTTKGDHNPTADLPIQREQIVGQVIYVLPKLGAVISWLRTPLGLALGIYAPALVSALAIIAPLWRSGSNYQAR